MLGRSEGQGVETSRTGAPQSQYDEDEQERRDALDALEEDRERSRTDNRVSQYDEDEQERRDAMDALEEDRERSRIDNQRQQQIDANQEAEDYEDAMEALRESNRQADRTSNMRNRRRIAQRKRRERSRLDRRERNEARWEERNRRKALARAQQTLQENTEQGQLGLFDKQEMSRITAPQSFVARRNDSSEPDAPPYLERAALPGGGRAPYLEQPHVIDYSARISLPVRTKPKPKFSDKIEATFEILGGLVSPTSQTTKHLLSMTTELVGGLLLGDYIQRSLFKDESHQDARELARSAVSTALTGVLLANPVTAVALGQKYGQSTDSAAYHTTLLATGIFGSAISKFVINRTLPQRLANTRSAAGLVTGVLSWAMAPIVAKIFTEFKEVAQEHAASTYNEQAELQKAIILKDSVNNLTESAEQEFEAEFVDEDGNEIASDSETVVGDLQDVEDASGEPLPFDVNLNNNPFLPGGF